MRIELEKAQCTALAAYLRERLERRPDAMEYVMIELLVLAARALDAAEAEPEGQAVSPVPPPLKPPGPWPCRVSRRAAGRPLPQS